MALVSIGPRPPVVMGIRMVLSATWPRHSCSIWVTVQPFPCRMRRSPARSKELPSAVDGRTAAWGVRWGQGG